MGLIYHVEIWRQGTRFQKDVATFSFNAASRMKAYWEDRGCSVLITAYRLSDDDGTTARMNDMRR